MNRLLFALVLVASVAFAEDSTSLPEKLQRLKTNYEAAVLRAAAPVTATYVQELQKLKQEYLRAGDRSSASAADALINASAKPATTLPIITSGDAALSRLHLDEFKAWLATVVIKELTGFRNTYTYDGNVLRSSRAGAAPREHPDATIAAGRIFVPFTSTNATIQIGTSRTTAEVAYSTGQKLEARIEPRIPPARKD